ncbi:MAG: DnaB-like helicase C-terminal domain-containing protein [Variovorax sp.]
MAEIFSEDDIDFARYEEVTDHKQKVKSASVYVQALLDRVNSPIREKRVFMPWGKTHKLIQFRRGEVTVWGGPNGSGKSLVTGQVGLSLCAQDEKVAIASFEMKPIKTLERMGRQWTGHSIYDPQIMADPAERRTLLEQYESFRDWTDRRLWLYDQQGTVHWKQVCAVARYAAQELGVTQFFVDNLMKCVAGEDDYNGQKAFVDELCSIARDDDIHIHLIHHVKKPATDGAKPTKYDFKGTGAITDQPDNVIAVWRNKAKERTAPAKRNAAEVDALLIVDKQRNGEGWEGNIGLWYLPESQQFVGRYDKGPMEFFNAPAAEEVEGW